MRISKNPNDNRILNPKDSRKLKLINRILYTLNSQTLTSLSPSHPTPLSSPSHAAPTPDLPILTAPGREQVTATTPPFSLLSLSLNLYLSLSLSQLHPRPRSHAGHHTHGQASPRSPDEKPISELGFWWKKEKKRVVREP